MDIKEKARNLPQETVDRIQDFFDGKRKLEADELGYDKDNLLLLNELVNSGRITLPESKITMASRITQHNIAIAEDTNKTMWKLSLCSEVSIKNVKLFGPNCFTTYLYPSICPEV